MTTRLIVVIGFLCAFAAGFALDLGWKQHPSQQPASPPQRDPGSWLAEQLELTPEQQTKMKEIWSDTARRGNRQMWEQRRQLREQREAAIAALIRDEDRAAYERIQQEFRDKTAALEAQWRQSYEQAVEKTKALLNDEQRKKYEIFLENQRWDGRDDRRRDRGPSTSKASESLPERPNP